MAWGILANAAVTGAAAAAYALAAWAAQKRLDRSAASAVPLLFASIATYLLVAALRQGAAWRSVADPSWVDVDRALYLVVIVPAAFVIVPHVHVVSLVAWGNPKRSMVLACTFLAVVAVGLAFAYVGGVEGPVASDYGTDWTLNSPVTKVLLLVAIMLPGLVGSAGLVAMSRRLYGEGKRRVVLVGVSTFVYFLVFTLDAFGLSGLPLLGARLATVGTGALAWTAYQTRSPPMVTYAPPKFEPDQMMYERPPRP